MFHSLAAAVLSLALAPVYDGVERKVRAAIHSRIGPPVLQTWYDILKLFSKELVVPSGGSWTALVTTLEALSLAVASATIVYLSSHGLARGALLEAVLLAVLVSVATALAVLRAASQSNIFSVVGGFREFFLTLSAEPFAIFSLLVLASGAGSLASRGIATAILVLTAYVVSGRVPYDIAEAEPELASGINIELSGPLLGVASISTVLKKLVSSSLTALAITSLAGLSGPASLATTFLLTPVVWVVHTVVSVILGRSRVDLAMRFLLGTLLFLTLMLIASLGLGL